MKSLGLLTLLSVFAVAPLLAPGYFWSAHDARHSVYFLFEFSRSIGDGIWYPRWMPDFTFGYGYPFFNINGPLAYYVGTLFLRLGLDYVDATKLVFGLAIIGAGWAMFGFVRSRLNERAGLIAALVYVYAPYHLLDVYVRGALAETVALVFLPLCLWAFGDAVERPRGWAIVGASLAYVGLMLAHSGIALLFSLLLGPYLIVLVLIKMHRSQPLNQLSEASAFPLVGNLIHVSVAPLLGLIMGIGLSGIFLVPSLLELGFVRTDQYTTGTAGRVDYYDYHNHFTYFFQLFSPRWGFGLSVAGPNDTLSLQLGAAATVLALLSLLALGRIKHWRPVIVFLQVATVVLTLMMLPQSTFVWEHLPLVAWAQFPWRFLALAAVTMAPLAGVVLGADERNTTHSESPGEGKGSKNSIVDLPTLLLATLVLLSSYPYATAEIVEPTEGPVSFAGLMKFQHNAEELTGSTAWVHTIPTWGPLGDVYMTNVPPTTQVDYASLPAGVVVDSRAHSSIMDEIWVHADTDSSVMFDRFMYPGWHAYLLDKEHGQAVQRLPITPRGDFGLISVAVPQGEHYIVLRFEDTPPRVFGTGLTLLSASALALWGGWTVLPRAHRIRMRA
jgi:hypothetical protein